MKKTTKKIILGLGMSLLGSALHAQDGLEKIIVEKYYISTAADTVGTSSKGKLPIGSVTYRVYADMLPGFKFQALYGNSDHALKVKTSTTFFNNEDRGATTANAIASTQLKNNTIALDSWFSVGASAAGQFGVLKSEDNGAANLLTLNSLLKNNNSKLGIPLTTQDGNQAGSPEAVTLVGLTTELDVFDATSQFGNSFSTTNGAISALSGAAGPTAENRVLLGQFTTDGVFSFEFNIQIGTPTPGVSQKYVVSNPINGEKTIASLKYETNQLPNVSITSPANNATFLTGAVANITASASDIDGTVSQVEFFVDGKSVGVDNTAPYEKAYTTILGNHLLTAVAKDNKGDSTISEEIKISVKDNQAPTVTVGVVATAITGYMVALTATANDVDGTVDSVRFFVDNNYIGTDKTAPYSFNWNATVGSHKVKAIAIDNKGLTGTSKDSTILVKDNVAPIVTVSNPANAITGDAVVITATATDSDGTISSVEFFVDDVSVGTDATSPYTISYKTTVGKHFIKAVATDNFGLKGTSKKDSITVVNNQAPIVELIVDSIAKVGANVLITANATDTDGSIKKIEFFMDNVVLASDSIAPYTSTWKAIAGKHTVKIIATDNRGLTTTKTKDIMVTNSNVSIETIAANLQTLVYPNPANQELSIIASENASLEITDISGKVIAYKNVLIANTTHHIAVSEFSAGVYLVRIYNDNYSKTERVVINN
jgi:hypothetical protein